MKKLCSGLQILGGLQIVARHDEDFDISARHDEVWAGLNMAPFGMNDEGSFDITMSEEDTKVMESLDWDWDLENRSWRHFT